MGSDELPASVIQRIQSFLTPKQSGRTTLLSKSWLRAWSTCPTILLDQSFFPASISHRGIDPLVEFARKTFGKYDEETRIQTFRLCLKSNWYGLWGLTATWTLKALNLGATDLTFRFEYDNGIYIPIHDVFRSENLACLCVENSSIDRLKVVKCAGLKSLALSSLNIPGDSFLKIISSCPLIEKLSLSDIYSDYSREKMAASSSSLDKLESLVLCRVAIQLQTLFLDDLSSKFPNLKDLTIRIKVRVGDLDFLEPEKEEMKIMISSCSLEILNYMVDENECYYNKQKKKVRVECEVRAEFDVPSIRKFTFEGEYFPKLAFSRSRSEDQWESHVSIKNNDGLSTTWFCELSNFLTKLRTSKIHLCLHVVDKTKSFDYRKGGIEEGLNDLEVEDLTMNTKGLPTLSFHVLLDALFRICRPKMITKYSNDSDGSNDLFLCRALEEGMKVRNFLIPSQYMYGLRDLEEMNLQKLFDGMWRPQPSLDSIIDDSQTRFRLQLKWKCPTLNLYILPKPRVSIIMVLDSVDSYANYSELPEPIIHRIQSFLTSKEAAQTTLISKSWDKAWSTRQIIDLDESYFPSDDDFYVPTCRILKRPKMNGLAEFATKAFRRYEESELCIDTFRLCSISAWCETSGIAKEWILKALGMGATDLTLRFSRYHMPDVTCIPMNEIFGSEDLVSLCLENVNIDQRLEVIKCSRLKSLTLSSLRIARDSFFIDKIISCSPFIQNLSLSYIYINYGDYWDDVQRDVRISDGSMISLPKLTSLVLCNVQFEVETLFLDDLSSKFPNLKDLTIDFESGKKLQIISSRSLEILNFKVSGHDIEEMQQVEFDVPSIRKFTFEGSIFPKLHFRSTSWDQFQSHVSLTHNGELNIEWFCKLSKFLSQLRGSKIHLCLHVHYSNSFNYQAGDIKGLNVCEVEDLTMDTKGLPSISFDALLDSLFRICRPMMITQYVSPPKDNVVDDDDYYLDRDENSQNNDDTENTINTEVSLWQALEQGMKVKNMIPSQFMYGLRDLEEVNAQVLFEDVWMPQPFDSVLDSMCDKSVRSEQRRYRFLLKWKS